MATVAQELYDALKPFADAVEKYNNTPKDQRTDYMKVSHQTDLQMLALFKYFCDNKIIKTND